MAREYKDSGIEWIGKIPKEWKVKPHKHLMRKIKNICLKYNGEDIISLTMNGVVVRDLNAGGKMPTSFDGYQYVYPGNLLMCLFDIDVTPRCVGLIKNDGLTSPAYSQFTLFDGVFGPYYNYLLRYMDDEKCILHLSKNLRSSLTEEDFGQILTIYPPLNEQQRIADYLDKKCGEIDELIALQEQMIAQLSDYKQSVITEAVTKGLNPNVELVPSGIDWIGDVPKGWKVCKLKYLCNYIKDGTHFSPNTIAEGYPYITATDVRGLGIDYANAKKVSEEVFLELQKAGCQPHNGDILLVKDGATTGRVGMMTDDTECVLLSSVAMLSPNKRMANKYLMYVLMSDFMQSQMKLFMAGAALPRITLTKLMNFNCLFSPLSEQNAIVAYLDEKYSEIDSLISLKQQKIEELKEYKKSIIYEYVTGKKELI